MTNNYWQCPTCRTTVESSFQVCWKCGTDENGIVDETFGSEIDPEELEDEPETPRIACGNCDYRGKVLFTARDKPALDWVLAALISLLVSQRSWIQFCHQVCPRCGAGRSQLKSYAGEVSVDSEQSWETANRQELMFSRQKKRTILFGIASFFVAAGILWYAVNW